MAFARSSQVAAVLRARHATIERLQRTCYQHGVFFTASQVRVARWDVGAWVVRLDFTPAKVSAVWLRVECGHVVVDCDPLRERIAVRKYYRNDGFVWPEIVARRLCAAIDRALSLQVAREEQWRRNREDAAARLTARASLSWREMMANEAPALLEEALVWVRGAGLQYRGGTTELTSKIETLLAAKPGTKE